MSATPTRRTSSARRPRASRISRWRRSSRSRSVRAPTPFIRATAFFPRTRPSRKPARTRASSSSGRPPKPSPRWARRPRRGAWPWRPGVPVVPGALHPLADNVAILAESKRIGFPLMLKAAAGGGGKGLRLVHRAEDLEAAVLRARSEAKSAFGDDSLYIERAILKPRHIEIQVLADTHGNAVHLFERECSIQRRHQKIIEESPSPFVTPELRERMGVARGRPGEEGRLRERGHPRVPGGREPRALFPGDEHAAPGRASDHRDGDGHRSREDADPHRAKAKHCPSPRRTSPSAATRSNVACAPRIRKRTSSRIRGRSRPCAFPAVRACATTRASTKVSKCRCSTTR